MITTKPATTDYPILDSIKNRWSPYAFADTPVEKEKIMTLLEASRFAPSSYNDQPWSYVIGYKGDETHAKLADCLVDGNSWAKTVPVLMLSIARKNFAFNQKSNRHFMHDTGASSAYMHLQAAALDLAMHQMAGFYLDKARMHFNITDDFEPAAMIAIGYYGDRKKLPDDLKQREEQPRSRKPLEEMIWKVKVSV